MIDKNFINEIKKIVGREFVHTLPEELACYSYDSGVESISPVMVVSLVQLKKFPKL